MAEPDETQTTESETKSWGTWEELLLACAVHRHGASDWDSIAAEVGKRTSAAAGFTPLHCHHKYLDLKLRYGQPVSGSGTVPWLDELRSTRVQELKREVQRCDLSIVSLQLKVKRLKEGREDGESSDLEKTGEKTVEPVVAEEDRSVNESNSTDSENKKPNSEPEPAQPGNCEPVGDNSCNGSSDSVERKPIGEPVKVEPVKESSDVQSWAGESDKVRAGFEELGNEDRSPAVETGLIRSQPLVQILEMVRSHKLGSVFEHKLMVQEAGDSKSYIRQHVDIETIHKRLEEGYYKECHNKFFRDLLLLFNNATLSFGKSSPEFVAAVELRKLITRKINQRSKKSDLSTDEQKNSLSSKLEPEPSDSLVPKPKILGPIIVCRKRSSIAGKASGSSSVGERKKVQKAALLEDKPLLNWKQLNKSSANADETENMKKRTSDRFVPSSKISKKNGKKQSNPNHNKISELPSTQNQVSDLSSKEHIEPKSDKNSPNLASAKKKTPASGTKAKQKSSTLLESLKNSEISPNNRGAENKKLSGSNGRAERKREQHKGRQAKEQDTPVKRNNGRVGKRVVPSSKRSRDGPDTEVAVSSRPKKRTRR